jgi:hypothetical protein
VLYKGEVSRGERSSTGRRAEEPEVYEHAGAVEMREHERRQRAGARKECEVVEDGMRERGASDRRGSVE